MWELQDVIIFDDCLCTHSCCVNEVGEATAPVLHSLGLVSFDRNADSVSV